MSPELAVRLRAVGHEAEDVREVGLAATADPVIFEAAQARRAVVITFDLGYGKIALGRPGHAGVVIARFPQVISVFDVLDEIILRLGTLRADDIQGNIVLMKPDETRIKRPTE